MKSVKKPLLLLALQIEFKIMKQASTTKKHQNIEELSIIYNTQFFISHNLYLELKREKT